DDRARGRDRRARGRRGGRPRNPRRPARALAAVSRDRREGDARPGLHQRKADRGGGRRPMSRLKDIRRRFRQTSGRRRKLRGLAGLLAPYRWRVLAMFVALVAATGSALAPAPLAKLAIDGGIKHHDVATLDWV